jgi:lysozyme
MGGAGTDAHFEENYAGATANGVASGFYHLLRTDSDGAAQARHFLRTIDGKPAVFLAPDVEKVDGQPTLSQHDYAALLRTFLETLDAETNTPIWIYTSPGEWAALVGNEQAAWFAQFGLWVANHGVNVPALPAPWTTYVLHQYTDEGALAGVSGNVDLNRLPKAKEDSMNILVPYRSQWDNDASLARGDCLIVCVAMLAAWKGIETSSDALLRKAGLPVGKLTYTFAQGMAAAKHAGFAMVYHRPATWQEIKAELDEGRPTITLLRYGKLSGNQDNGDMAHFVVVTGYTPTHVILNDPNFWGADRLQGQARHVPLGEFVEAIGTPLVQTGNMAHQSLFLA